MSRKYQGTDWNGLAARYESGESIRKLSAETGINDATLAEHFRMLGAISPHSRRDIPRTAPGPTITMRGGHPVRHFTLEEDRELRDLATRGMSLSQISRQMGRAYPSIRGRLISLALHDAKREAATA